MLQRVAEMLDPGEPFDRLVTVAPLKNLLRVVEKLVLRLGEMIPKDIIRAQIRCKNFAQILRALQIIRQIDGVNLYLAKNKFKNSDGWADLTLITYFDTSEESPFGVVTQEIQVVHHNMMLIREGLRPLPHDVYEEGRFAAELLKLAKGRSMPTLPYGRGKDCS